MSRIGLNFLTWMCFVTTCVMLVLGRIIYNEHKKEIRSVFKEQSKVALYVLGSLFAIMILAMLLKGIFHVAIFGYFILVFLGVMGSLFFYALTKGRITGAGFWSAVLLLATAWGFVLCNTRFIRFF